MHLTPEKHWHFRQLIFISRRGKLMVMENKKGFKQVYDRMVPAIEPEEPLDGLVYEISKDYNFISHLEEKYFADMDDFFRSTLKDPDFPDKAERWRASQRTMLRCARTIVRNPDLSEDDEEKAFDWVQRITRDALLLEINLYKCYFRINKNDVKKLNKVHRIWTAVQDHCIRIDVTRAIMEKEVEQLREKQEKAAKSEKLGYLPEEIAFAAAKQAKGLMNAVPEGHYYLPAKPYPPERIPDGEPVPTLPMPFAEAMAIDPKHLAYDLEHDEFYIPEGYVSEDGRLDHDSLVWDWEKEEVTVKYVGGPPTTWKFWKPKDLRDGISGWAEEYYYRIFDQIAAEF